MRARVNISIKREEEIFSLIFLVIFTLKITELFLFLLRTPDTIIRFFESQNMFHRTGRAETSFFIKSTRQALSRYTE
jgi:hypothetical protein